LIYCETVSAKGNSAGRNHETGRKIVEYYNGCKALRYPRKPKDGAQDVVFIKDGHLVAFARFEPKQGGIYASNNEVMPNFHWQPHGHLARLRKMNKAFYREVKKAAFAGLQILTMEDVINLCLLY